MTVRTRTAVSLSAFMSERVHGPKSRSQSPLIFLFSPRLSSCVLKGENYGENKGDLYVNTGSSALIYNLSDLAWSQARLPFERGFERASRRAQSRDIIYAVKAPSFKLPLKSQY